MLVQKYNGSTPTHLITFLNTLSELVTQRVTPVEIVGTENPMQGWLNMHSSN